MNVEIQPLTFRSGREFRAWLEQNQARQEGAWLRIFKKGSGRESITYAEALDQALCYGWIDGQIKGLDELSFIQKFTPRRSKSTWSKINVGHVERLIQGGQMTAAGLAVIEAAKVDGRWQAAYDSHRTARPPKDFLQALSRNKKAKAFFQSLNKTNVYAIVWRLQTAPKPETREKRLRKILDMLDRGEKFHP